MTLKFGTDGVRGAANVELSPSLALSLGRAAARVLGGSAFLVGRDTRRSGPMLQAALSAGLAAEGCDVLDLGVLPTPAVAFASAERGAAAAMVSASHNSYTDNGIKLFAAGGRKLTDEVEERLEAELDRSPTPPETVGTITEADVRGAYLDHLLASVDGRRLNGLHVVLDCANGAASGVAPEAFGSLAARVDVIHAAPDGVNINAGCGSTYPGDLQRAVVDVGADLGLAFDGDADRVLAVDHTGALVDGDHLIALYALDRRERGLLHGDTVVVTVMANMGFRLAMEEHGVAVHETRVGDRYVLEALEAGGWSLGGEQSGHVIFRELATTGDGLLTGVQLADLVRRSGRRLHDLAAAAMTQLPQVLHNVVVARRDDLAAADEVWDAVAEAEAELGGEGRVLLRPSGTEQLVRVMVEAPSTEQAERLAARLSEVVHTALA